MPMKVNHIRYLSSLCDSVDVLLHRNDLRRLLFIILKFHLFCNTVPPTVQIHSKKISAVISRLNAVRIYHRNDHNLVILPQKLSLPILRQQILHQPLHHIRPRGLPRMLPRQQNNQRPTRTIIDMLSFLLCIPLLYGQSLYLVAPNGFADYCSFGQIVPPVLNLLHFLQPFYQIPIRIGIRLRNPHNVIRMLCSYRK